MGDTEISKELFRQYEVIRSSGNYNMATDVNLIQKEADSRDFHELVVAIDENKYSTIIQNYSELNEKYDIDVREG